MANLTLRGTKGIPLTNAEMDANLTELDGDLPASMSYDNSTQTITLTTNDAATIDVNITEILDIAQDNAIAVAIVLGGD